MNIVCVLIIFNVDEIVYSVNSFNREYISLITVRNGRFFLN